MNFQKVCICKEQHLISQKLLLSAATLLSTWLSAWLQQVPFPTETNGIVLSGSRSILLERVMNIGKQHQGNTSTMSWLLTLQSCTVALQWVFSKLYPDDMVQMCYSGPKGSHYLLPLGWSMWFCFSMAAMAGWLFSFVDWGRIWKKMQNFKELLRPKQCFRCKAWICFG